MKRLMDPMVMCPLLNLIFSKADHCPQLKMMEDAMLMNQTLKALGRWC